ncbi:helix-hairpin-helix domain-containing protein [Amycolatopsis sp., V23-08]|uniref:Helix-hairpin-helix domain-containing protein n=1 Tax=Amycolatopsis heterodermiae TaxID=3110235 RepID=A0ABU5QZH5_9PSEU|nr:helix-hairpin-helix domain-containing protein [Amycolatopsis sp., V23-08]MEA5359341.1 helix-hairpin-helix domain-containing protein [Amycolatopsis sp., V23-08]
MSVSQPVATSPSAVARIGSRWYFVVTIVSFGFFAWVPFVHAALRLGRKSLYVRAVAFGAAATVVGVLLSLAPTDAAGKVVSTTGNLLTSLALIVALAVIAVACVQQSRLRREILRHVPGEHLDGPDPALAAALAARDRRTEARKLAIEDPLIARDLGIGRPDLPRNYDDGGLVDLNNAPADVIASVCGLDADTAAAIVDIRTTVGGFAAVEDVGAVVPFGAVDRIRDRAVVLPA